MPSNRPAASAVHAGVYRRLVDSASLQRFRVCVEQSDLLISARSVLEEEARAALLRARRQITGYAETDRRFYTALQPLAADAGAPEVVRDMLEAGRAAEVGPMAAVAGAIAQYVGEALRPLSDEVIVENGGDVFMYTAAPRTLCVLAESAEIGSVRIRPVLDGQKGFGVCTSSGKLGPSLSLGNADSVTVLAARAGVADALATRLANLIRRREDVQKVLDYSRSTPALGVVILMDDLIGVRGALEIERGDENA